MRQRLLGPGLGEFAFGRGYALVQLGRIDDGEHLALDLRADVGAPLADIAAACP